MKASGRGAGLRVTAWVAALTAFLGVLIVSEAGISLSRGGQRALLLLIPVVAIGYLVVRLHKAEVRAGLKRVDDLMQVHFSTMEALTLAIDAKDPLGRGHVRRVQAYAMEVARRMKMSPSEMHAIRTAALLHDIGKLAIPDHLLSKPGKLSDIEFQKVKAHPTVGAEILANVGFPYPVVPIIRYHHERWDGSGYPEGLEGEAIPLGARILAVADALEALTSDRVYRRRRTAAEACELIEAWAGIHYDPQVVEVLRDNLESVIQATRRSATGTVPGTGSAGNRRFTDNLTPAGEGEELIASGPQVAAEGSDVETGPDAAGASGATTGPAVVTVAGASAEPEDAGGFGDRLHHGVSSKEGEEEAAPPAIDAAAGEGVASALSDIQWAQREVYALYEIAQALSSSLRLAEVLELVVTKIGQLVPYRTCAIYLLQDGGEGLTARFVSGANAAELRGRTIHRGDGITGWTAAQRSARFSTSPDLDLVNTKVDPNEYSMIVAFPLLHDAKVLGVISLYFPKGVPCLDDHIRIMEIIAKLAAGAVFNSTIFAETQESAMTDDLTNLPNSRHLRQVFEQERIRSQQSEQPMALLEMDLDNFKAINDRFGHQTGDLYLTEISRVLRAHLRDRDILVRLSGDEFAAVLPATSFAAAALLAERLQQAVDLFSLRTDGGRVARSGLSVGIAIHPQDGETLEDLMARADVNMYRNKRARRDSRARRSPNVVPFPVQSPGSKA